MDCSVWLLLEYLAYIAANSLYGHYYTARLCIKTNPIPQKAARSGARFRANPLGEILAYPSCRCRRFFLRKSLVFCILQNSVCRFVLLCREGVAPLFRNHIFIIKIVFKSRFVIVSNLSKSHTTVFLFVHSSMFTMCIVHNTKKCSEYG